MKSVFLDFATVSSGDLSTASLEIAAPNLTLLKTTSPENIEFILKDHDIVILNKIKLSRELIAKATHLKLIALAATGTNNIDLEAAREYGVAVCNIHDYCTPSVVQHVLGVLLSLTHKFTDYSRDATNGTWAASSHFTLLRYPIRELKGRTIGIIGWGVLGQAVAHACQTALGMEVLIANRIGTPPQVGRVALSELLARADVVSLHCPLNELTLGMISKRELSLMRRGALLINTARGELIDIPALVDALRSDSLGGAAIDVLPEEPPCNGSPLFAQDLPNLIITPHIAWSARESRQRCLDEIAINVKSYLEFGKRWRVA